MIGGVRSTRLGYPLSRGQILPCKLSRWGNPPSRGRIRGTSNSLKIHFAGGFPSLKFKVALKDAARVTSECRSALIAKTRGLPAFFLFTCLAAIQ